MATTTYTSTYVNARNFSDYKISALKDELSATNIFYCPTFQDYLNLNMNFPFYNSPTPYKPVVGSFSNGNGDQFGFYPMNSSSTTPYDASDKFCQIIDAGFIYRNEIHVWTLKAGIDPLALAFTYPIPPKYTKLKLGHFMTVTMDTMDLSGSKLTNVAASVNPTDAVIKSELTSAIASIQSQIVTNASTATDQALAAELSRATTSEQNLRSQLTTLNDQLTPLYQYLFNTTPSTAPTR